MKKQFLKFIPIVFGAMLTFTACSDDDSTDPQADPTVQKPVVNVTINGEENEAEYSVMQNAGVTINLNALSASGGGSDLDKIRMIQNGDNAINTAGDFDFVSGENNTFDFSTNTDKDIKNAENNDLKLTGTFTNITANTGTTTYDVVITDKDGLTSTRTFKINVFTTFSSLDTGRIYHIAGRLEGSYDLVNDMRVSAAGGANELNADIINTDAANATFTGSFKVGDQRASTSLVRVPAGNYDFEQGSIQAAEAIYDAGSPVSSITNPAEGDIVIYSLGLAGDLAVVRIMEIDPTNDDCSATQTCNNKGRMTFEYKK